MLKRGMFLLLLIGLLVSCAAPPKKEVVTVSGDYYEMEFHLPAWWEDRLDEWDEYFIPPSGHRFLVVDIFMRSVTENPIELRVKDYELSYTLGATEYYTTTLTATGNNDIYSLVSNFNYGGATAGYKECYVFVVPEEAQDFVLEITSHHLPFAIRHLSLQHHR